LAGSCAPVPPPEKATVPRYPVAVFPLTSFAVTVTENGEPAVAFAGAATSRTTAAPGVNVTAVEFEKAAAFLVAVTVAVPALVEDVRVAE